MKRFTTTLAALLAAVTLVAVPACTSPGPAGGTKTVHESGAVIEDAPHVEPGNEIITYRDYDQYGNPIPHAAEPAMAPKPASAGNGMLSASLYVPTGDSRTSAVHLQKIVPAEVTAGDTYDIKFIVTNLTGMSLDNVVIYDALPSNFKVVKTDPSFPASAISKGEWMVGTLGPHEAKTIVVTGTAGGGTGTLASCADVKYQTSICLATAVVQPALQLMATGPDAVNLCDPIVIKYTVKNTGSGDAKNVMVTGTYPAGLTDKAGHTTLSQNVGTLGTGQSKDFAVTLMASKTGAYSNSATAAASGNLKAASNAVKTTVSQASLALTMTGTKTSYLGRTAKYSLNVSNKGTATAEKTMVTASVPSGLRFLSATAGGRLSGGKVSWSVGSLAAGKSMPLEMTCEARDAGSAVVKAEANADCADAVVASADTMVTGIPALLVEVVDQQDPVLVGETTTYLITVTNQGSADGTNISVSCTLPGEETYVSSTGNTLGTAGGQNVRFAPLANLAPKASASWKVVVRANKSGNVRFAVTVASKELGAQPVSETEATTLYE